MDLSRLLFGVGFQTFFIVTPQMFTFSLLTVNYLLIIFVVRGFEDKDS